MNTARAIDLQKPVWEGWTVQNFIDELAPQVAMIMEHKSWRKPFTSKQELDEWCRENQPYCKKRISGVTDYFARMYNLK